MAGATGLGSYRGRVTSRAGLLTAWANAWLAGAVGTSEVTEAVTGGTGGTSRLRGRVQDALLAWRKSGNPVKVVLPVPGDVRGLPGPAPFRTAALDAGEAVVGGELGLVPIHADHWRAYDIEPVPDDFVQLSEAQHALTEAIRETASILAQADFLRPTSDVGAELGAARRIGETLELPRGFPAPAVALVAQAERMQAVLDLAPPDLPELRGLATAVRRALTAGYNTAT